MSKQNGVLEMAPGHEFLMMPGPGRYNVNWSPGAVRYKLERAPSGHLILPCDAFAKLQGNHGGLEPMITLYGTKYQKHTSEIGTQTDTPPDQPKTPFTRKQKKPNMQNIGLKIPRERDGFHELWEDTCCRT